MSAQVIKGLNAKIVNIVKVGQIINKISMSYNHISKKKKVKMLFSLFNKKIKKYQTQDKQCFLKSLLTALHHG